MTEEHATIVYALILHHYCLEKGMDIAKRELANQAGRCGVLSPYGVRTFSTGKGITTILSNLPTELQCIINSYVLIAERMQ